MELSSDLISQFVKNTRDNDKTKEGATVNGTIVEYDKKMYVRIDGSDLLTPYTTTVSVKPGQRVTIDIKDHTATITGNRTDPSASSSGLKEVRDGVLEVNTLLADKVSTKDLEAERARIGELEADNVTVKGRLTASEARIGTLEAENVTVTGKLTSQDAVIENLKATKLDADVAKITYATIEDLTATNADIHDLHADYADFNQATAQKLTAIDATITNLGSTYANIDFSNIGKAAIKNLYATSGLIKDIVVGDGTVTGELVGVTIKGDLIEGNTIKADKLVIKGTDGLYYKLNTDGVTTETEQTDQNSLNGSVIMAKSITATKIAVDDLVAFDATIGGFNITSNALYSGVKSSANNTIRGVYLDRDGQLSVGDAFNFLKYYKDADGNYKLEISAQSLKFGTNNKNLESVLGETITKSVEEFYVSTSPTALVGGSWSTSQPTWTDGTYIWRRTAVTYGDGSSEYTPSSSGVCITGNTGQKGDTGAAGQNGKSTYVHIKYSSVAKPTTFSQMTDTPSTYIGMYVDYTETASTDPSDYTWSRFRGDQGIPGVNGTDGKTSYLHIAYANSADGKTGFGVSDSANKLYIGQYTDFVSDDSTDPTKYSWSKIKGDKGASGVGVKSVTNYYLATNASSDVTVGTSGWTTTVQSVSSTKKYLWNYELISYSDDATSSTSPCIIGVYGDTGAKGDPGQNGKSIGVITNYYLATSSSSGVDTSTSGWTTTVQSVSVSNKYLWNYEVVKYSDNTIATTSTPCIIGAYGDTGAKGDTGATGNGISTITEYYQVSTSNTTPPSSWETTAPKLTSTNKYLWNYETITYTNGTTKDTTKRVIGAYGDKGSTGDTGNGISVITEYYQVSASNTTAPTSWQTTVPTMTATNKYLWNYETVTYTNGTTKDTAKRVIGVYGNKGDTGETGADAISLSITSSNGIVFKNNTGSTVLTAHVYKGGVEQSITSAGVCGSLGSVKWYKGGSTTAIATANSITVSASDVTNAVVYTCQLEG